MRRTRHDLPVVLLGALAVTACEKHPVFATGQPREYGACGVCFNAPPDTLFRAHDTKPVDTCAFRFRGQGITVDGDHGKLVGTPEKKAGYAESPGGALRARYQQDGEIVERLFLPRAEAMPNLLLTVTYSHEDRDLRRMADGILTSAHRCETGAAGVIR